MTKNFIRHASCATRHAILLLLFFSFPAHAEPLKVVASFSILTDMVHQIGGDDVRITTLVGPNDDAHAYEPSPADVKAITNADMVVANGLGFEGWLDRLTQAGSFKGPVVVASDGVIPRMLAAAPDPHAWQSVPDAKRYVANIRDALMKADPAHAQAYDTRATAYLRDLGELDIWVRKQISSVPLEKRIAITSHDAFGYFADEYHVAFVAPLGLSTATDISAGDMAHLIDQIRSQHVKAVFLENMTDPRLIRQLVNDAGAVIGGTLCSDALSPPGGEADTYISLFHHNVKTLVAAMRKN